MLIKYFRHMQTIMPADKEIPEIRNGCENNDLSFGRLDISPIDLWKVIVVIRQVIPQSENIAPVRTVLRS